MLNVGGTLAFSIDNAAPAAISAPGSYAVSGNQVSAQGSNNGFMTVTVSASSLGTHTLGVSQISGPGFASCIRGYNSQSGISFLVHAAAGANSAQQAASGNGWSNMDALKYDAPDLTMIKLGLNDGNGTVSVADYTTYLQAIVTAARLSGDVLIVSENAANPANFTSVATQDQYHAAAAQVAASMNVAYCDIRTKFGADYARLGDNIVHPNRPYLADIAAYEVACILAMVA